MKIIYTPPTQPKINYPPSTELHKYKTGTIVEHENNLYIVDIEPSFTARIKIWRPIGQKEADQIIAGTRKIEEQWT